MAATAVSIAALVAVASPSNAAANTPVATAATPDGTGYWMVDAQGDVTAGGSAHPLGDLAAVHLSKPIVGIASTPSGHGYWLVASDGGVFCFGDARFFGSTGGMRLARPVVGVASTVDGAGYWLVAADGGIFNFGDARFFGSTGSLHLAKPVVGIAPTGDGAGYTLLAGDGGIFTFGDARFYGSTGADHVPSPVVGMAYTPTGGGYWISTASGSVYTFGDATFAGAGAPGSTTFGVMATPGGGYTLLTSSGPQHFGASVQARSVAPAPAPAPVVPTTAPPATTPAPAPVTAPPTTVAPPTTTVPVPTTLPHAAVTVPTIAPPAAPAPAAPTVVAPSVVAPVSTPQRFIGYWNAFGNYVGQLQSGETYGWGPSWDNSNSAVGAVRPEYQQINISQASQTIARQAHARGELYAYKPLLTNRGITPTASWFDSYLHTVLLPAVTGNPATEPDVIVLDTELDGAIGSAYDANWRALIASLKAAGFKGKLLGQSDNRYIAGWFDSVDYVGGDFYPPIDTSSLSAATASWQQQVGWQVDAYAQSGKPVVFAELGSYQGSMNAQQWSNYLGGLFSAMSSHRAWAGALFWSGWGTISATQPQPQTSTAPPVPASSDLHTAARTDGYIS